MDGRVCCLVMSTHTHTHTRFPVLLNPVFTALLTDALNLIKDKIFPFAVRRCGCFVHFSLQPWESSNTLWVFFVFLYILMSSVVGVAVCPADRGPAGRPACLCNRTAQVTLVSYSVSDRRSLCRAGAPARSGKEIFPPSLSRTLSSLFVAYRTPCLVVRSASCVGSLHVRAVRCVGSLLLCEIVWPHWTLKAKAAFTPRRFWFKKTFSNFCTSMYITAAFQSPPKRIYSLYELPAQFQFENTATATTTTPPTATLIKTVIITTIVIIFIWLGYRHHANETEWNELVYFL